jgi:hypothetical protein
MVLFMQDKLPWLDNLHIEAFGATGLWTVTDPMGFGLSLPNPGKHRHNFNPWQRTSCNEIIPYNRLEFRPEQDLNSG